MFGEKFQLETNEIEPTNKLTMLCMDKLYCVQLILIFIIWLKCGYLHFESMCLQTVHNQIHEILLMWYAVFHLSNCLYCNIWDIWTRMGKTLNNFHLFFFKYWAGVDRCCFLITCRQAFWPFLCCGIIGSFYLIH